MSCIKYKCLIVVSLLILLCPVITVTSEIIEEFATNLPATEGQLNEFKGALCNDLFYEDETETLAETCKKNLTRNRNSTVLPPRVVAIKCQTEYSVTFEIEPQDGRQIIALVPYNTSYYYIFYTIMSNESIGVIEMADAGLYSFWSSNLDEDSTLSMWRKGPDLPDWREQPVVKKSYEITKELILTGNDSRYFVDAVFSWNTSDKTDVCFEVTNFCQNKSEPIFVKKIRPYESHQVKINSLSLDNECRLTVKGKYGETFLNYHTPSCDKPSGCGPNPAYAENVSLWAVKSASGEGWDVRANWSSPYDPELYNITLLTDELRSIILPGNATEVVFRNVVADGVYSVSVVAIIGNKSAHTSRRAFFPVFVTDTSSMGLTIASILCALLLLLGAVVLGLFYWKRQKRFLDNKLYYPGLEAKLPKDGSSDATGTDTLGADDVWEVRPERLLLHEVIGEGAFGVVRRGTLAPGGKEVAVKMLKDYPNLDEIRSFHAEMELMKSVGAHPHVVSLVGCCSGRRPFIIAEYCSRGDLLSYLRYSWDVMVSKRNVKYYNNNIENFDYRNHCFKNRILKEHSKLVVNKLYELNGICDEELTAIDLLSFCRQIAMGMEFLALNRVVHRDLATRNILVSGDKTLKIADFGLSRDVYQENQYTQKGNGKMPIKWMALESLTHRIYTTQSDVWSFGVVLWEVVTVGGAPYPEVPAARLLRLLKAGYRMPRPNNCSKQLYELMLSCWRTRPRDRPTFSELHEQLDTLLNGACADEYLCLELEGEDAPPTPKHHRYFKIISRAKRAWTREIYERPLRAPQSNHYTSLPAVSRPQVV